MEVKPKTISQHNQKTDTMAQPEKKVSPAHAQRVYLFLCHSVCLSVSLSLRRLREEYRVKECLPERLVIFYQRALKEYYNCSLISTCTESSQYFKETMVTVRL
jgi:hypothetical protein